MSLLQDFQEHEKIIGRSKIVAIDFYIKYLRNDLTYEKVIYNKKNYESFELWYIRDYRGKKCYNKNMEEVSKAVVDFTKERDWDQFHSPENLAKSIAIESGELLECFQWNSDYDKTEVCEELADVVNYSILLADKLGVKLEDIVMEKLEKNRKKYPVEKAKGKSTKYDKL
jgi:NTP pyrophosphatase (non-canonical NTP hydrolase)